MSRAQNNETIKKLTIQEVAELSIALNYSMIGLLQFIEHSGEPRNLSSHIIALSNLLRFLEVEEDG